MSKIAETNPMTGRKNRALQVHLVLPYKALEKFPKALYGTTGGTCSARFFRPVMQSIVFITIIISRFKRKKPLLQTNLK